MFGKTLVVVLLSFSIGCGEVSRDVDQPLDDAPDTVQLPNVAQWVKKGGGYFQDFGVADSAAPNKLLFDWKTVSPPDARKSELEPSTAQALHNDIALAIDLYDVPLTEETRSQLSRLRRVQWLRLSAGVINDDLNWIGGMKQLRGLALTRAKLTGADFQNLAKAQSLQYVTLSGAKFSDVEFGTLPRLKKLEVLCLSGSSVNDACLTHLAKIRIPSLRSLNLEFSSVTDEGLRRFCEVYDLEYLNLYGSYKIPAESVPAIAKMKRLRVLGVGATGISPQYERTAAVAELIRRLPKCRVDYGD